MATLSAKYCSACGYRLIDYKTFSHYDENTGVAYYKVEVVCPDWHWLRGRRHTKHFRGMGPNIMYFTADEVKEIRER